MSVVRVGIVVFLRDFYVTLGHTFYVNFCLSVMSRVTLQAPGS